MSSTLVHTPAEGKVSYRGLRGWLDEVQKMGELLHVNGAHWDAEMGAVTQMLTEKSNNTAPAILFDEGAGLSEGIPHPLRPLLVDPPGRAHPRAAAQI